MTTHRTPLGYPYTAETMAELKAAMPNMVARGEGQEFFEMMLDSIVITDKILKGVPPNSPAEAEMMAEARKGVALFNKAVLGQTTQ